MRKYTTISRVLQTICDEMVGSLTSVNDRIFQLLTMLSPLEPLKRHQDVKLPRSKNTGTWLLSLESYCEWRNGGDSVAENSNVFCCYGIPGAGKTVIWY